MKFDSILFYTGIDQSGGAPPTHPNLLKAQTGIEQSEIDYFSEAFFWVFNFFDSNKVNILRSPVASFPTYPSLPDSEEPQPRSSLQDRLDRIRDVGNDQEGEPDQTTDDHRPPVSQVLQSADCLIIRKPYGCAISRQEFEEINFLLNTWLDEIPRDF